MPGAWWGRNPHQAWEQGLCAPVPACSVSVPAVEDDEQVWGCLESRFLFRGGEVIGMMNFSSGRFEPEQT